jgi:hypothetical protein
MKGQSTSMLFVLLKCYHPTHTKRGLAPVSFRDQQKTSPILRKHSRGLLLLTKGGASPRYEWGVKE